MYNVIMRVIGVIMKNKKNVTLVVGLILSLCSICDVYAQDGQIVKEKEPSVLESPEIKVDKDTPDDVVELIDKKEYNSALPLVNAYIESKPKKYIGYQLRGEIYYALRQYDLAIADFQKAIEIKTDDDKFATNAKVISAVVLGADKQQQYQNPELGLLYARLMYAQKALNNNMYEVSYKKALEYNSHIYLPAPKKSDIARINCPQKYGKEFNPQGIDVTIYGIIDDIEKGHFSEAAYKLPKLTTECPDYYLGQYLTGVVMYGLEQDENAIIAFNNAIKLNPNDFESYASLGLLYYYKAAKTFDDTYATKSIENFEKAIALNPNYHTYYFYIGLNQMELGDYSKAVENFQKAITINPKDYNSMYYKSIAQYLQKDYNAVVEQTTKMLYKRVSNYNSVLYLRALAYYRSGNVDSAIADIEKIHQNMNDIFNLESRLSSQKDKVLDCYLYFLQSKIARDNGFGAKADLQKAYQNPIIALLDTRSKDFAQVNYKLTTSDIEEQYEYLITTFDNLGVGFEYLNPDYKIVAKKPSKIQQPEKIVEKSQDPTSLIGEQDEEAIEPVQKTPLVAEKSQEEKMVSNLIAEMKEYDTPAVEEKENKIQNKVVEPVIENTEKTVNAEPSTVVVFDPNTLIFQPKEIEKTTENSDNVADVVSNNTIEKVEETSVSEEEKPEKIPEVSEKIENENSITEEKTSENLATTDDNEDKNAQNPSEEQSVTIDNNENISIQKEELPKDEIKDVTTDANIQNNETETKSIKEDTKDLPKEQIKNENSVSNDEALKEPVQKEEPSIQPQENLSDNQPIENPKTSEVKVNEKYAKVNLAEFEVKNKKTPNLKEGEEVVFLEPESFLEKEEQIVNENLSKMSLMPKQSSKTKFEKVVPKTSTEPEKPVDVNITKDSDNLKNVSKTEDTKNAQNEASKEEPKAETKEELTLIDPEEIKFPEKVDNVANEKETQKIAQNDIETSSLDGNQNITEKPTVRDFSKEEFNKDMKTSDSKTDEISPESTQSQGEDLEKSKESEDVKKEEIPQPSDSVSSTSTNEVLQDSKSDKNLKKNKIKKSKTKSKDNLLIAVGGDIDKYAKMEDKKLKETKEKKSVKDKDKTLKTENVAQTEKSPEILSSNNSETDNKAEKVSELQQEKKIKETKTSADKKVSEDLSSQSDVKKDDAKPQEQNKEQVTFQQETQNTELKSDDKKEEKTEDEASKNEISDKKAEVQPTKKVPFWKRWFSRKKNTEKQIENKELSQPEETK